MRPIIIFIVDEKQKATKQTATRYQKQVGYIGVTQLKLPEKRDRSFSSAGRNS